MITYYVPLWEHIIVVLALLGVNAMTFFIAKRRIETLKMALVAKRALMGEPKDFTGGRHTLLPGGVLMIKSSNGTKLAEFGAITTCEFNVVVF